MFKVLKMNACLEQIIYWNKALKESQKGHRRKNRKIVSLQLRIDAMATENRELMLRIAKLELLNQGEGD